MSKIKFFPALLKKIKNINLEEDTIKVSLSHMNKKGEIVADDAEVIDFDDIDFAPSEIKARYMFVDGQMIDFEHTGDPITKVGEIQELTSQGKWIWHSRWGRGVRTSQINKMPFRDVVGYIRMGWLYHYKPKSKNNGR